MVSDCTATTCQAQSPDQTFTTGVQLAPVEHEDVGAAPVSGTIRVKVHGQSAAPIA